MSATSEVERAQATEPSVKTTMPDQEEPLPPEAVSQRAPEGDERGELRVHRR